MTANDYAREATNAGALYDQMKPADKDPNRQAIELTRYHLLSAQKLLRQLAETLASQESKTL